jgi:hypothetical protein
MLREPKKAYWVSQRELDFDTEKTEENLDQDFDDMFFQQNSRGNDKEHTRSQIVAPGSKFIDEERKDDLIRKTQIKHTQKKVVSTLSQTQGLMLTDFASMSAIDFESEEKVEKYKQRMLAAI